MCRHYNKQSWYFTPNELLSIITANYFSVLYYNADVWLLPSLLPQLKQKLLSASAAPLKLCTRVHAQCLLKLYMNLTNVQPLKNSPFIGMPFFCTRCTTRTPSISTSLTYFSTSNSIIDAILLVLSTQNPTKLATIFSQTALLNLMA